MSFSYPPHLTILAWVFSDFFFWLTTKCPHAVPKCEQLSYQYIWPTLATYNKSFEWCEVKNTNFPTRAPWMVFRPIIADGKPSCPWLVRLPQCQRSKPDGHGKISQCITTTKHSKTKTVCIFLGIYCRYVAFDSIAHNFLCFMNSWTLKDLVRHIEFVSMMQRGQVDVSDTVALQMPGSIQYEWVWASMLTAGVLSRQLMYLFAWCRWVWTFSMTECQGHVRPWVNWESGF